RRRELADREEGLRRERLHPAHEVGGLLLGGRDPLQGVELGLEELDLALELLELVRGDLERADLLLQGLETRGLLRLLSERVLVPEEVEAGLEEGGQEHGDSDLSR